MSITPVGGWDERPSVAFESGVVYERTHHACPNCGSDEWKTASMTYIEGLSSTRSVTRGSSIGVARVGLRGGRFAVGGAVHKSKSLGTTQTVLSAMAAPPRKAFVASLFLCVLLLLSGCMAAARISNIGWDRVSIGSLLIAMALLPVLTKVFAGERTRYQTAVADYADTRVCQRCGSLYLGSGHSTRDVRGSNSSTILGVGVGIVATILLSLLIGATNSASTNAVAPRAEAVPVIASSPSMASDTPATVVSEDLPNTINAADLLAAYRSDEQAANASFRGHEITVTGKITGIFSPSVETQMRLSDKGGATAFITMAGPVPSTPGESVLIPGIHADSVPGSFFGVEVLNRRALSFGNTVSLRCRIGESSNALESGGTDIQLGMDHRVAVLKENGIKSANSVVQDVDPNSLNDESPVAPIVRQAPPSQDPPQSY